jgi:hypothetical protein
MGRVHLFEFEDMPWCPRAVRDGGTDWLQFMQNTFRGFDTIAPKLRDLMSRTRRTDVIDLCSGGGGPWLTLERTLAASGDVSVTLSDFFPNEAAFQDAESRSNGRISCLRESIDATNVPEELDGVRTLFNSFHHFRPDQAQAILADAVRKRRPIAVFEWSDSRWIGILMNLFLMPLWLLLLTPLVRPFRWSRLLLTYALPAIPAIVLVDGAVSMLRIYSPSELDDLVRRIPGGDAFEWEIGTQKVPRALVGVTYLMGWPKGAQSSSRTGEQRA